MNPESLRWLKLRWRGLFHRRSHETALNRELQFHFDQLVAENIRAGLSPTDARLAAQREFGADAVYREECRDTWRPAFLTGLLSDFTFALRGLRRSPAFTAVAVFTLALGIGVNATIFAFLRQGILRPLARDHQHRLVALYNGRDDAEQNFRHFSHLEFEALRETSDVFAEIAAQGFTVAAVGPAGNLQRRFISFASDNFFRLLGTTPFQGRFFTAEEARPGASLPVIVANHSLWERLGRPADFIGTTLRVNQRDYTVIGIAPPGFVGVHVSIGPDVWLPLGEISALSDRDLTQPGATAFSLIARLQPGLTLETARQRLDHANRQLNTVAPLDHAGPRRLVIDVPPRADVGSARPQDESYLPFFATIALALSLLVLLVACLNLANMLLARGAARQKEIAIRLALGACRWRVVRSLLAEGLLLSLGGAVLGLVLSFWGDQLLIRWAGDAFDSGLFALGWDSFFDGSIVLATLVFSLIATLAFSLWPALRVTRPDLTHDLKRVPTGPATASRRGRFLSAANASVVLQIAISLALLISAALFVRSSHQARSLDLGFETSGQLVANVDYSFLKLDPADIRSRQQSLLAAVNQLPGVTRAALAQNIPYSFGLAWRPVRSLDAAPDSLSPATSRAQHWSGYTAVTHGYFATLGIPLLRGRDFTTEESSGAGTTRAVAIIDQSLAQRLFGGADPIGRRITAQDNATADDALEIVGVIRRFRNDVFEARPPLRIFRPLGQVREHTTYLHLRTSRPLALADPVRRALREIDPQAPLLSIQPFADYVEKNINMLLIRLAAVVFGLFGLLALVLAIVGIYGVKAYAVARRTREIGVRIALGARPRDILNLILKQGLLQTAVGVALGVTLSLVAGRVLARMLYHVNPWDPLAVVVSASLLTSSVLLACWLPARRATRVDPVIALRTE